ncbi:hypothetical protein [Mesorhizobium sp. KR2-14]
MTNGRINLTIMVIVSAFAPTAILIPVETEMEIDAAASEIKIVLVTT